MTTWFYILLPDLVKHSLGSIYSIRVMTPEPTGIIPLGDTRGDNRIRNDEVTTLHNINSYPKATDTIICYWLKICALYQIPSMVSQKTARDLYFLRFEVGYV